MSQGISQYITHNYTPLLSQYITVHGYYDEIMGFSPFRNTLLIAYYDEIIVSPPFFCDKLVIVPYLGENHDMMKSYS